jgi:hypothetical protein
MPSKTSHSERSHDRDSVEGKEKRRHKSTRTKRRSRSKDGEDGDDSSLLGKSSASKESSTVRRKSSMPIPELGRRSEVDSPSASRTSLPYPSFSKAHSRESVNSKESLAAPSRKNVFTPDPTDLTDKRDEGSDDNSKRNSSAPTVNINVPPSPPLTATEKSAPIEERRLSPEKTSRAARTRTGEKRDERRPASNPTSARVSPSSGSKLKEGSVRRSKTVQSKSSVVETSPSRMSSQLKSQSSVTSSTLSSDAPTETSSAVDSEATSATPKQVISQQAPFTPDADDESSPATGSDSSVRTPTPRGTPFPAGGKQTPVYAVQATANAYPFPESPMYPPPPPPPPPPPMVSFQTPRVDYLMQHGGLTHVVPKKFITAPNPDQQTPWVAGELPNPTDMLARVEQFFAPFKNLLDDYTKVVNKSGSIAVATGYRSIARRLLDRLEAVFARDISSEVCACSMCDTPDNVTLDDERGISWGEILEYVSGRKELPQWPPFVLDQQPVGLGISDDLKSPCQTLDIDVPEEYREHYIRQSKKTKESVDSWLAGQNNDTSPPEEADDDTLTFAILTHLDPQLRPIYKDFLGIKNMRPASIKPQAGSRTQTPLNAPKTEWIERSTLAIQRLYRLINFPRAPEVAVFLVSNQHLHNVLATLAAISDAEWDILTSGRFDGFLRSGAEDTGHLPQINGRLSRGPTPISRGPTPVSAPSPAPASAGPPVTIDEETEIAVLAEVEREIYMGMEALEDAFESLHLRAENVRRALRERGAGLAMAAQARRGSAANVVEARLGTPASVRGFDSENDDWLDDTLSELAPDDSASMISKNRVRRPKRRDERRTPAPIEEEEVGHEKHGIRVSASRNSMRKR